MGAHPCEPRRGHALSQRLIPQQADDGVGQRLRVARRDEQAGLTVLDDLWDPPVRVATTGRALAMASRSDVPSPSVTELMTKTSNPLWSDNTSGRNPARMTFRSSRWFRICF